jgi:inner membrane protein
MPSPVGHILGGAAVYLAAVRKQDRSRAVLGLTLLGSILPDFDFFPGFFTGKLFAYHHGISHSLTFAVFFTAVVFILAEWRQTKVASRAAILAGLGYASHIILDFLGNPGPGMPIFWPLSDKLFGLDLGLLGSFYFADSGIWSVVRRDNASTILRELLIIGSPVLFLLWKEHRSKYFTATR